MNLNLTPLKSALLLLVIIALTTLWAKAQQPVIVAAERDRGVTLYQQGDDAKGAVGALRTAVKRDKNDIRAWHDLGLALETENDKGSALKAHEKAAKLGESLLDRQLDEATNSKEIPRSLLAIRSQLVQAAESAERYVALSSKLSSSKREEWSVRISSLRGFADLAGDQTLNLYSGKEVTTKPRILSKSEPTYTEEARKEQITGTVVLRCIFGANGKVFGFRVLSYLPAGLTEQAIRVARQIKFVPATKDGQPVSMWMELQYNFNLY